MTLIRVASSGAFQRKDVELAYRKNAQFYQPKKKPSLTELEDLLLGNKEILDIKGPSVPVQTIGGPTPEETIELLEKVRSTALADTDPTPQDLRTAATATAKIQSVQSQITLHHEAARQIEIEAKRQREDEAAISNRSVQFDYQPPGVRSENIQKRKFIEQAIAKYSHQVHLKKYGFTDQQPSFFRIA